MENACQSNRLSLSSPFYPLHTFEFTIEVALIIRMKRKEEFGQNCCAENFNTDKNRNCNWSVKRPEKNGRKKRRPSFIPSHISI